MIIVIKYRLLTSLLHHFNTTVAKNFPGYEYAIRKNIGRSAPKLYSIKFLTREAEPPPPPLSPSSSTPLEFYLYNQYKTCIQYSEDEHFSYPILCFNYALVITWNSAKLHFRYFSRNGSVSFKPDGSASSKSLNVIYFMFVFS